MHFGQKKCVIYKFCIRIFLFIYIVGYVFFPATVLAPEQLDFNYHIIDENNNGRVAIGDIDGDGRNDIVVHSWDKKITWYKYPNWEQTIIAANDDIRGDDVLLVDLDNDGDLDFVCGFDNEGANVWWFENPLPKKAPSSGNWAGHMIGNGIKDLRDIRVIDLDNDGEKDVIARHQDRVYLYFQNISTGWTKKILYIRELDGMDLGDIDRDGDEDIVLNGFWLENPLDPRNDDWPEHSIDSLWYQQTGGRWRDNSCKVQVADINQDGRLDVVFSQAENTGYPIAWYDTANPKGGDKAWTKHIIGYIDNCNTLQIADMDVDGDPDVVAGRARDNPFLPLYIFFNEGEGKDWDQVQIYEGGCYNGRVGDIGDDGDLDFVSSRTWLDGPVYILRNIIGKLTIGPWERHVIERNKPWLSVFIFPGDLNCDGLLDIVTGGWWYQNPGAANGSWIRHTIGDPMKNIAGIYDFDMDGDLDLIGTRGQGSSSSDSFVWARNNGSGSFTILDNIQNGDGDFLQGAAIARFNNHEPLEIALSWHEKEKGIQMLEVPSDPSSNAWTWSKIHDSSQDEQLSAGDIDKDGDIDLLQGTKWLRNDGGSWKQFLLNDEIGNPDRNRLADIDADGYLDAVVGFEAISIPGKLVWYRQPPKSPTDLWTAHVISTTVIGPMSLDVADIDSDGDLDVVVGEHNIDNPSSANLYVFENVDRNGLSWKRHLVYTGDEHHDGAQVVDIDNDGDLDIISIGWGHDRVVLYENKAYKGDELGVRARASLVGWWGLDESKGLIAIDSIGSHNATLVNGPEWRPSDGKIRGALMFDGFDDLVDLGTIDVEGDSGLTIAFWFKADDFDTPDARFISKATGVENAQHYWMVSTFDKGALRFRLKTDGLTDVLISNPGEIQPGQWYHVSVTYNGFNMRIYKNAIEIAGREKLGNIDTNSSVFSAIGNQPSGAGSMPFDGLIDDIRIYNRALSASEIQKLMNGTLYSIYIDDSFVSDNHCDVGSEQTIGFHMIDGANGSNLDEGIIYVNEKPYSINNNGWAVFNYSSSYVGNTTFIVTGVNVREYSTFMQFAPNPTIIWDRVKIVEGGASKKSNFFDKNTIVWFKAEYEYDNKIFDSPYGYLYVNGSKCSWSDTYNRWEIIIPQNNNRVNKFIVSGIVDNIYGLKVVNYEIGPVLINPNVNYPIYGIIIMMVLFTVIFYISRVRLARTKGK